MRKIPLILWAILGASCSFLQSPSSSRLWERTGEKPKRVVLILAENPPAPPFEFLGCPHLTRLKNEGLSFSQAWVGHLPSNLKTSQSVILSGRLPKNGSNLLTTDSYPLLNSIPGKPQDKMVTQIEKPVSPHPVESFFKSHPDWSALVVTLFSHSLPDTDKEVGLILGLLEQNNWMKETLVVFTSPYGEGSSHPISLVFPQSKWPEVKGIEADSAIQLTLKSPSLTTLLKHATRARNLKGASEVYYKQEISKRYHYIRTYRSPDLTDQELEWAKNRHGALTQSLASKQSADILVLLREGYSYGAARSGGSQESVQRIPLIIWSPNLHLENEAIRTQIENSTARLVDIHALILKLMGISMGKELDGSPLGIEAVAY